MGHRLKRYSCGAASLTILSVYVEAGVFEDTARLEAVNFYDTRFNLQLPQKDKDDLVAFLKTL
jgi:hypothetical protein